MCQPPTGDRRFQSARVFAHSRASHRHGHQRSLASQPRTSRALQQEPVHTLRTLRFLRSVTRKEKLARVAGASNSHGPDYHAGVINGQSPMGRCQSYQQTLLRKRKCAFTRRCAHAPAQAADGMRSGANLLKVDSSHEQRWKLFREFGSATLRM